MSGANRRVTPEVLAQLVGLLPDAASLRDISAVTGLTLGTVRRAVAPFLAIMKLAGTHPQCGCGRDRFHLYGCVDAQAKGCPADRVPGRTKAESVILLARREVIVRMLVDGVRYVDIDYALGLSKGVARLYLVHLTPEQRELRARTPVAALRTRVTPTPQRRFCTPIEFADAARLLIRGHTLESVAATLDRSVATVSRFVCMLNDEQRRERTRNVNLARKRGGRGGGTSLPRDNVTELRGAA